MAEKYRFSICPFVIKPFIISRGTCFAPSLMDIIKDSLLMFARKRGKPDWGTGISLIYSIKAAIRKAVTVNEKRNNVPLRLVSLFRISDTPFP